MANSSSRVRKVETVSVSLNKEDLKFEDFLRQAHGKALNDGLNKTVQLELIRATDDYLLGYIISTKKTDIPSKKNGRTGQYERLPIDENNGDGLAYSNVFVYDTKLRILMYEFEKNGCYLSYFKRYLLMYTQAAPGERPNDLSFLPLLRREAYERALNMKMNKAIEIQVARPHLITKEFLEQNDWIAGSVSQAKVLQSDKMTIAFSLDGRPKTGMPSQIIGRMIKGVQTLLGNEAGVVEKLSVTGYYYDPEDDKLFKDEIDFILDRYKSSFRIELPNVASDPRTTQKGDAIYKLYLKCLADLRQLEPYNG